MALHEVVDQRHDEALAIGHGAGHAQQALGLVSQVADGAQRFFAGILQAQAMLQECLPGFGQHDLAGAAVEQPGLQVLFQLGDLTADLRGRQAQVSSGGGELAAFGDGDEFVQAFPSVHSG